MNQDVISVWRAISSRKRTPISTGRKISESRGALDAPPRDGNSTGDAGRTTDPSSDHALYCRKIFFDPGNPERYLCLLLVLPHTTSLEAEGE